jgi:uncharacterized phiE125 gp8 family phage protein
MFPYRYALKIKTEPTEEPITADDVKTHLRIDSGTLADSITETPSITIASYSTGTSTGTGVDISGNSVIACAVVGAVTAGTVLIHLEESDDDVTYADVVGSTFAEISTDNQNVVVEKEYTGSKQYVRANATVAGDAVYGVNILEYGPESAEDTYIESLITAARTLVEDHTGRRLITQTWNYYLDNFGDGNRWPNNLELGLILNAYGNDNIKLPYAAPLQSVSSITYMDSDESSNAMSTSDYIVDIKSEPGRVVLGYGKSWPSATLSPSNPINIEFVAGYGTSTTVPKQIKQAMLLITGDLYENRENSRDTKFGELKEIPLAAKRLLKQYRVWM